MRPATFDDTLGGTEAVATSQICLQCIAQAGLSSDRCERCKDYSAFECGEYDMKSLENLSSRGKLAFVLSLLAAMQPEKDEE